VLRALQAPWCVVVGRSLSDVVAYASARGWSELSGANYYLLVVLRARANRACAKSVFLIVVTEKNLAFISMCDLVNVREAKQMNIAAHTVLDPTPDFCPTNTGTR
jgi:hypothetical protein